MCPKSGHNGRIYIFKGQLSTIFFGYLMTSGVKGYEIQNCKRSLKVYAPKIS